MDIKKIIGRAALGALVLSAIPYQFKKDEETGEMEIRSLLWGWKKTPPAQGEEKAHVTFAIPSTGLNSEAPEEAEEPAESEAPEEPEEPAEPEAPEEPEEPAEPEAPEEPAEAQAGE